jgi:hypothetical protein
MTERCLTLDDWAAQNQRSVDFVKIDTDGHDIAVLLGAERLLSEGGVLGVRIEAQFHGPLHPFANTFHNIDGILRNHGFTLFDLNQRRYSRAALPDAFFASRPGRTRSGQLLWGDALYLRDLAPADYERMFAFWQAALRYDVGHTDPNGGFVILQDPRGKGPNLSLDRSPVERTGKRSWIHLDLYTTDQNGEVERLVGLGAKHYPWRYGPGADYVVLEDPDGHLLCVVQLPGRNHP